MDENFIAYGAQDVDDADVSAVSEVLRSPFLTTGPAVPRFESRLSSVIGGTDVAVVSSGTAALHCAYKALDVGPGDEVITTPFTFAATATGALHCGAAVRFADVDDRQLNIDRDVVASELTPATKVIAAVDFAGHPADIAALRRLNGADGVTILEDAAHSLGASVDGVPVGALAPVTTFSFHPVKIITTAEGGGVASRDKEMVERVRLIRNHGLVRYAEDHVLTDEGGWHQEVQELGFNYRLPDVLAALGTSQLNRLGVFLDRRRQIAARYLEELADVSGLRLPHVSNGVEPAWHLFVVRVLDGRRREIFDRLRSNGVGVQVHYLPVHLQPLFQSMGYRRGSCPVAEQAYEEVMSIPIHPRLTDAEQTRVIDLLKTSLRG